MKTIFKSLLVAALFVGVGTTASAQALGVAGTVGSRARILKQIVVANNDSIIFGTVAAGNGQTFLDPQGATSSNIGINNSVGRLVISASPEEPIRIDFDTAVTMQKGSPAAGLDSLITFRPVISVLYGDNPANSANRTASTLLSNDPLSSVTIVTEPGGNGEGPTALFTTDNSSEYTTFFIGGYLYVFNTRTAIPSTHGTGTYIGAMNFNIYYNL